MRTSGIILLTKITSNAEIKGFGVHGLFMAKHSTLLTFFFRFSVSVLIPNFYRKNSSQGFQIFVWFGTKQTNKLESSAHRAELSSGKLSGLI